MDYRVELNDLFSRGATSFFMASTHSFPLFFSELQNEAFLARVGRAVSFFMAPDSPLPSAFLGVP